MPGNELEIKGGRIGKDGCELVRDELAMERNFHTPLFDLSYTIFLTRLLT